MKKTFITIAVSCIVSVTCLNACGNEPDKAAQVPAADITTDNAHPSVGQLTSGKGESIFKERCMVCHGISGNARKDNAANLQMSKLDSLSIANTIKTGRNGMPMFGSVFPDSDLAQLVIYVKSLRK